MLLNFTVIDATPFGVKISVWPGRELLFEGITVEQMAQGLYAYKRGNKLVQNAFHFLSTSQREFLMTGMTDEEWDQLKEEVETDGP